MALVATIDMPAGARDADVAVANSSAAAWAQSTGAALSAVTRTRPSVDHATVTLVGLGAPQVLDVPLWKLADVRTDYAGYVLGILNARALAIGSVLTPSQIG
jgi:hypothetical protein